MVLGVKLVSVYEYYGANAGHVEVISNSCQVNAAAGE
jgi:hypothetical protein